MKAWTFLCLALLGCGRFGFSAQSDGRAGSDGSGDSSMPGPPVSVATGEASTCAIARGMISCWGIGTAGQLGNGGNTTIATPQPGPAIANPVALDGGLSHMCVLDAAGAVSCWGDNKHGQLAQPATIGNSNTAIVIAGMPAPARQLAVGGDHACAILTDASLWCWGKNSSGQIGLDPVTANVRTPTHVLDDVIDATAGDATTCAVKSDNSVWCWGTDSEGELGDGLGTVNRFTPMAIAGLSATQVSCGDKHCCAIVSGDHYTCWGYDNDGELGDNSQTQQNSPNPPSMTGGFARMAAGNDHTCAIGTDGSVSCWGADAEGEVGDASPIRAQLLPVAALTTGPFVAVDAGGHHTCAIRGDGSLACWGDSSIGQVGDGTIGEWSPRKVTLPATATVIATGALHTCAIAGGVPYCWGSDWYSEIGDSGLVGNRLTPVAVTGMPPLTQLALGDFHSCGLTSAGAVYCWGSNYAGQLGDGTVTKKAAPVLSTMAGATQLAAGFSITCGANATDVQCWGKDDNGQLGDNGGAAPYKPTPLAVGVANTTSLAVGGAQVCALNASLTCWGDNDNGEIGIGTTSAMEPKRTIAGSWSSVATGTDHTCAVSSTGTVSCWGDNGSGQLGDGTRTTHTTPNAITIPGTGPSLELGDRHACAITSGGLYCWGSGTHGTMGDGSGRDRLTPTLVPGITGVAHVAAGSGFSCAIDGAGAVWCWGDNSRGQIGIGTLSAKLTPVEIALP